MGQMIPYKAKKNAAQKPKPTIEPPFISLRLYNQNSLHLILFYCYFKPAA
jgi:hypothetical protein